MHIKDGGIKEVDSVGPLAVSIDIADSPKSIKLQPCDKSLDVTWSKGIAKVTIQELELYSILVVEK